MCEIDITPQKDGGVLKQIIKEGSGNSFPPTGSKVIVHYTGTLLDGTKFDSSRDRGTPFEFDLGKGMVIKAWDIGVASMKKGEQAILTCASQYAYGEGGSPPTIPPNATLKFDVEVLDWMGEDLSPLKDRSIEKVEILQVGTGASTPNEGAQVEVHLTGKFEDVVFDDRDVTFNIGEGEEANVIEGIEIALLKFKKGESSRLIIKPIYAFERKGAPNFHILPDSTVEYIVTLKKFEKAKESWAMDGPERIEQCKIFKEKGTNYFKDGKYELAIKLYTKIESFLKDNVDDKDVAEESKALLLATYSNIALCHLKLENYFGARMAALNALKIDPNNEKALFRCGQAYLGLKEAEVAAKYFADCLKINHNNSAAKAQQAICNKIVKEQLALEKKLYADMFDKFAKKDAQREESEKEKEPNVMSCVGEWGKEDREREPSEFEKENPNILMLNSSGEFKDM